MNHTPVYFRTNVDCCKRLMNNISGLSTLSINPLVGDRVRVYHDSEFDLYMQVYSREWILTNGANPELTIILVPEAGHTTQYLEDLLRKRGFQW